MTERDRNFLRGKLAAYYHAIHLMRASKADAMSLKLVQMFARDIARMLRKGYKHGA